MLALHNDIVSNLLRHKATLVLAMTGQDQILFSAVITLRLTSDLYNILSNAKLSFEETNLEPPAITGGNASICAPRNLAEHSNFAWISDSFIPVFDDDIAVMKAYNDNKAITRLDFRYHNFLTLLQK